jgi:hypothetical protein
MKINIICTHFHVPPYPDLLRCVPATGLPSVCLQCPREVQLAAAGALSAAARELPAYVGQVLEHVIAAYEVRHHHQDT